MTTTTNNLKGSTMTTKLIGTVFALVIGTIVTINLISLFSDVRQSIQTAIAG